MFTDIKVRSHLAELDSLSWFVAGSRKKKYMLTASELVWNLSPANGDVKQFLQSLFNGSMLTYN